MHDGCWTSGSRRWYISSPSATAALVSAPRHPAVLTASIAALLRPLMLRALETLTTPEIVNGCKSKHTGNTRSLRQRDWTAVLAAAAPALLMSRLPHPQNPRDTCSFPGVIIQSTPHVLPHPRAYSTCCDMTIPPTYPQNRIEWLFIKSFNGIIECK